MLFAFAQQIISDFYSTSAFAVAVAVTYAVESLRSNPFDRSKIIRSLPYYSDTAELTFISLKQQQKNTFFKIITKKRPIYFSNRQRAKKNRRNKWHEGTHIKKAIE